MAPIRLAAWGADLAGLAWAYPASPPAGPIRLARRRWASLGGPPAKAGRTAEAEGWRGPADAFSLVFKGFNANLGENSFYFRRSLLEKYTAGFSLVFKGF